MDILLTDKEIRVLGCLMEKEMATPDYYPFSLNALTNACNQKSNRNPVVSYDEETVAYALNGLRERKLARESNISRVPKYEQTFSKDLNLIVREEAIVCILLVRGPQTIGEIRNRTERLYAFSSLDEVQEAITRLEHMELISKLPRQLGHKESRYVHLLSEEPQETIVVVPRPEADAVIDRKENVRMDELQKQIDELRQEMQRLQLEFETFKSQFD
ncbi:YceH family protein [Thermodesulfobacteriota bacterium]